MRNWLTPLLLISLLGCRNQQPEEQTAAEPPNIVVIVADDLGYNDLGVYGSEIIKSPNIDKLAVDGVRLTDGYVAAAVCSPSRAGLYTGRYQPRFGYEYNPTGHDEELGLPTDQVTLADMMKEAGYATGLIGKWHQGKSREYHPLNRGFDEYFGTLAGSTSYIDSRTEGVESWPEANAPTKRPDSMAIFDGYEQVEVEEYLTDVFAAKSVDYIERHKNERFFLMLTPNTPHTPLQATAEYTDRYKQVEDPGKRIFAAMVSSLDDYVGDVVETLHKNGLEDNTLLVFLSDNGCIAYLSEPICSNAPLSGSKRFHLEGGVRVPFIFKWPAKLPMGKVYSEPAIAIDLFSTFAAAAGSDASGQDSVNLLPYLEGENTAPPHEFLFWRSKPNMAVRWGNWKMWKVNNTDKAFDDMTVSGRRLPEEDFPGGSPMGQTTVLYDLSVDIGEQRNVAGEHPEIVQRLEAELKAWDSELAEPIWKSQRSTLADLHGQMVQLFF